jgi:hypothetical protein
MMWGASMAGMSRRQIGGTMIGIALALAIPVSNGVVALLWGGGVVQLDPDGAFVRGLEAPGLAGILFGPIGIVVAGWYAGVRTVSTWFVLIVLGIPLLTILWFYAISSLGGLAGEPF